MLGRRLIAILLAVSVLATTGFAEEALVKLTALPSMSVADGKSTVTITAEVRDTSGHIVPNNTLVSFSSTLGSFRDAQVSTVNGLATAILVAGGIPGTATITAQPNIAGGVPTTMTYEFVGSRSELSTARDYVEIVAPSYMQYANDNKIIGAAAPNRGVSIRYRDVDIQADDIQLEVNTYILRARNARVKFGRTVREFTQLNLNLRSRTGYGTTNYTTTVPDLLVPFGEGVVFLRQTPTGGYEVAPEETFLALVQVRRESVEPHVGAVAPSTFKFVDLSGTRSSISAKKATVFPGRKIQFQRAEIYVAGVRVMQFPLYVYNMRGSSSPLVTDDILSVNDNQIGINYPQYLSLQPGLTSDLRFHMGDRYGSELASDSGAFLDYELNWDRGQDMEGGLVFGGIGREDWSVTTHQYWRIDDATSSSIQLGVPANSGIFASGNMSHQFNGFSASVDANHSQTFTGITSSSQSYGVSLTTDPSKIAGTPIKLSYGLEGTETQDSDQVEGSREQQGGGFVARAQSNTIPLDKVSGLTASLVASKLFGENVERGIGLVGAMNITRQLSKSATVLMTYNYTQDGFNDQVLGRHMVTMQGTYAAGNTKLSLLTSRSFGLDRYSLSGDLSYRLTKLWRVSYTYTSDEFLGDQFLDYNMMLSYLVGWREVGLTWSYQTHRLGFELMGARF